MGGRTGLRFGRSAALRVLFCVAMICALVASFRPAEAAVHWSSSDPVFTFRHRGLLSSYVLDVQVLVPLEELPLSVPAQLNVDTPSNVDTIVVNPPNPVFPVVTSVTATAPATSSRSYPVEMELLVPGSGFPVRLLFTDPLRLNIYYVEGTAGVPLRTTFQVR
jgi:hypothetical protein